MFDRRLSRVTKWLVPPKLDVQRRPALIGGLVVAVAMIGALDYITGPDLSLAALYTVVVAFAALISPRFGLALAVICAVMWEAGEAIRLNDRQVRWIDVWNAAARFIVLAAITMLVARILSLLAAARESDRRSREFLAFAAHQLRTPVAAIHNSSEALLLHDASPGQEVILANIARETSRAGRLVATLLRVARLDQGELGRRAAVDLDDVCGDEVARARQTGTATFNLSVDAELPPHVIVDPEAVREALANLLDNARRHARARVDVSVYMRGRFIVIAVEDDGPGVPSGMEERVFERFVTLDQAGGTGLGLVIARELARRGGGDVAYTGRAFELSIPLAVEHAQNIGHARST